MDWNVMGFLAHCGWTPWLPVLQAITEIRCHTSDCVTWRKIRFFMRNLIILNWMSWDIPVFVGVVLSDTCLSIKGLTRCYILRSTCPDLLSLGSEWVICSCTSVRLVLPTEKHRSRGLITRAETTPSHWAQTPFPLKRSLELTNQTKSVMRNRLAASNNFRNTKRSPLPATPYTSIRCTSSATVHTDYHRSQAETLGLTT